ncbi:MAG: CDP-alcohol phosphatidyltransferase family protein [Thermoprotei archaeon]
MEKAWTFASVFFVLGSFFDAVDGSVARAAGRVTKFGGFLDSTLDRYSDGVILSALVIVFPSLLIRVLGLASLIGSYAVSYTRSRAEALGVKMEGIGLGERAERLILILSVLLFPMWSVFILAVLAVIANATALQRIYAAKKALGRKEEEGKQVVVSRGLNSESETRNSQEGSQQGPGCQGFAEVSFHKVVVPEEGPKHYPSEGRGHGRIDTQQLTLEPHLLRQVSQAGLDVIIQVSSP